MSLYKNLTYVFLFITSTLFSQTKEQYIFKHLIRADASIVSGYMYKDGIRNVYVNGNAEYYIDNKISVRGDANFLLGSSELSKNYIGFKDNHSIGLGLVYHLKTKNHFDPYFIFQPSIAYSSSYLDVNKAPHVMNADGTYPTNNIYYSPVLSPLATCGLGFNYYFQRFAHLFMETRYIYGQHLSNAPSPLSLEEIRITFGLGFNVFAVKPKRE